MQGFSEEGKHTADWPHWLEVTTQLSHLVMTFNSSVNFFISLGKHWRVVCSSVRSTEQNGHNGVRQRFRMSRYGWYSI